MTLIRPDNVPPHVWNEFRQNGRPDAPTPSPGQRGPDMCGGHADRHNNKYLIGPINSSITGHEYLATVTVKNRSREQGGRHTVNRCNARFRGSWNERFASRVRVQFEALPRHGFNNNLLNRSVQTRQFELINRHNYRNWGSARPTNWIRVPRPMQIPGSPRQSRMWPRNSYVINSTQRGDIYNLRNRYLHNTINFLGARRVQIRFNLPNNNKLQPLRQLDMRYFRDNFTQHFGYTTVRNFSEERTNYVYDEDAQIATGQGLWHFVHHNNLPENHFQTRTNNSNKQLRGFSRISHDGFDIPNQSLNALNHATHNSSEQPTHTWLTYILAPESGKYTFSYLNASQNRNVNDEFQFYKISASPEETGEKASLIESFPVKLEKDDIVMAYGQHSDPIKPLGWQISDKNRANSSGTNNATEVPASAMFLSSQAAILSKGIDEINAEGSDNTATFQIFSTRPTSDQSYQVRDALNIQPPENKNLAFNPTAFAPDEDGPQSTHIFHDYRIKPEERIEFKTLDLGVPDIELPTNIYAADFKVGVLQDLYAERQSGNASNEYESIRINLDDSFFAGRNMISEQNNYDIPIIDSAPFLSLSHSS